MAVPDILSHILEAAWEEAAEIRSRGEEEAAALLRSAEEESRVLREKLVASGVRALRRDLEREAAAQRLERRKDLLALKKDLLQDFFRKMLRSLLERPASEHASLLVSLLPDLPEGGRVEAGREEWRAYGPSFSPLLESELGRRFPGAPFSVAGESGGFTQGVRVRSDGLSVNLSFEESLDRVRERLEMEIAPQLFAG